MTLKKPTPTPLLAEQEPLIEGVSRPFGRDLYFYLIQASWPQVFGLFFLVYLLSNTFFALLYMLFPGTIQGVPQADFPTAFFFSVQTMSTIGYGALAPGDLYGNLIVTVEAACGLVGVALATGFVFAKISKPHAKIIFGRFMVQSPFNAQECLAFRIGNVRGNDIVAAQISVSALIHETTLEGEQLRRIFDLKLLRHHTPFFKLSWTLYHPLDQDSPLRQLESSKTRLHAIAVTFTGHDGTFSSTVYARHHYYPQDIQRGYYFADIMDDLPDGRLRIDYSRFHELKPGRETQEA